jgi:adenylate cyclase
LIKRRYLSPRHSREPPCRVELSVYGVGMEVERKFVVSRLPELGGAEADAIEQGYLAIGSEGEVRVRRKGEKLLLTAKRGTGLSREEAEVEIDRGSFERLWALTEGRRLSKRRHVVPFGGLRIEVDVYGGDLEGLIVAEVEFASEEDAKAFEPPDWFGEEVTEDHRYMNETLATAGLPSARYQSH